ncbi:replicative DNA helicase [Candidatus Uhrbacteria bacterium RIFCSPHIGHO2_02_FULL_47_44]|uniref:Replicative DNA helicase n=1 Tax=Candidatus Uhrbacteria bacterium RIFCSPLOWO2_02_FULL_48_18 TaxID=1802408 RepID=A0A1F7VBL9_9BACT|nr:MAG: replicative DNA helicase [Candidatus Uhrbacteria bacterium RIFCSPHIGHO2_02_FULL_47_44]OGL77364.1 MAG: replicative DNA helicase [Candidatus Uhrbacteria bacterium RIFCSPHIGHO2_12_FULL_47_12]OGL82295.1 MAG: replicative DNA helicase [Candidatus Uhrbacteria bacterium RIFCSPLOWO2_01_FULL_47_17]OGL87942.1 MAG: replicative DNA helicase [Candidatus Uhrbacteria bacterium RIFCSPLOWO2_02_FULL_48_18]
MATHERIPPQNLEAEQSLLGSLLIDKDAIVKVADRLQGDDFYRPAHQWVYETITDLFERHDPIDILSLGNRLEEKGQLTQVGGRAYLVELSNMVPTAANVTHYAEIVQKKATLRRLITAATNISQMGFEEEEEIDSTLDEAERALFHVSEKYNKNTFVSIRSVLDGAFERIDELHRDRGKLRGVATGYTALDQILAGFQKSDLIILAARPSCGKTALALDMARHIGVNMKVPTAFFSLEMSKEQLVDRMICAQANVDLWKLRTGRLSDKADDFPKIADALGKLSEAPIFIDDSANLNIMQLRTKARRLKTEHGLGMIVVDYLQLMEGRSKKSQENRVQEVAEISRGLKQIAKELDVPVLALAQLSRAVELTKPAIPKLSHLRDSGSIEQDADVVLFIYRKAADKNFREEDLAPEDKNIAEIHIAKHRNGPTGMIRLFFEKERASFRNLDGHAGSYTGGGGSGSSNNNGFAPYATAQNKPAHAPLGQPGGGTAVMAPPPIDANPGAR